MKCYKKRATYKANEVAHAKEANSRWKSSGYVVVVVFKDFMKLWKYKTIAEARDGH